MTSNIVKLFDYNQSQLRTLVIDNEIWFIAQDVCGILEVKNNRDALSRLDDDEKMELGRESIVGLTDDPNTVRLSAISESGLYSLVLSSRKPEAKPFKRWVTHDVIPAIRKHGKYEIEVKPVDPLDLMIAQIEQLKQIKADQELIKQQMELEARRLDDIEYAQKHLDGELDRIFKPDGDYYTIRGYAKLKGFEINLADANRLGRLASRHSKEMGIKQDKLPDPRYGSVGVYSERVLEKTFA